MPTTLINRSRAGVAEAVRRRIAGPEFESAHAQIWHTPGERWFSESDPIWRVHIDTSMFIGGIRALLLQSLHPVAMAAVSAHSGFRGDPWGRLQRTSRYLATTTYGTVADAERAVAIVRAIHGRVRGETADGIAYRADDPDLLAWIHLAQVDSFLVTHDHFGAERLTADDRDGYVEQTGRVASRLGVVDPPRTTAQLTDQLAAYRPVLRMTEQATEAADLLLHDPPLDGVERAGYAVLGAGAISTLPTWARLELALPSLPLADRVIARPLARSALRVLRWALMA